MTVSINRSFIKKVACVVWVVAVAACSRSRPAIGGSGPAPAAKNAPKGSAFLETMQSVPIGTLIPTGRDIERTPTGVPTKIIKRGTGTRHPTSDDGVILYSQVYDRAGHVVERWDGFVGDPDKDLNRIGVEMLRMMVQGEIRRIWFPDMKSPGGAKVTDYELTWITPRPDEETSQTASNRKSPGL